MSEGFDDVGEWNGVGEELAAVYISDINFPSSRLDHLQKHSLTAQDVVDTVQWPARCIEAIWLPEPENSRIIATGVHRKQLLDVVLYPMDDRYPTLSFTDGIWRFCTAFYR